MILRLAEKPSRAKVSFLSDYCLYKTHFQPFKNLTGGILKISPIQGYAELVAAPAGSPALPHALAPAWRPTLKELAQARPTLTRAPKANASDLL